MKIVLDNIVFSLQKSGGISTLWGELIEKTLIANKQDTFFLEYQKKEQNIVRNKLNLQEIPILNKSEKKNLILERFINPSLRKWNKKFVFVSSYYRTSSNKKAINVTVVHDFIHEYHHRGLRKIIHTKQKHNAIKKSAGVICISENTKKDLLHFFPDTNPSKIRVIYNGVGKHFYKIQNDFLWQEIGEPFHFLENKKCILFIGQRSGYKNFDIAVSAFSLLPEDYHLIIVGGKLDKKEISFFNKHLKSNRFSLFSNVDNETLNKIYNKSFALLYPSSYEGFGIPILEAMKSGLPVIAHRATSIPEVAGEAGVLVNQLDPELIKNEIIKLESRSYYDEQVQKGLKQATKFSWDKTMEEYCQFFDELYEK